MGFHFRWCGSDCGRLVWRLAALTLSLLLIACQAGGDRYAAGPVPGAANIRHTPVLDRNLPGKSSEVEPRTRRHDAGGPPPVSQRYMQVIDRGVAAIDGRRLDEAVGHFRQATGIAPRQYSGWLMLGMALMEKKLNRESMAALRKARSLAQQVGEDLAVAEADGHMGFVYYRVRSYELALAALNRSIQVMRRDGESPSLARNFYRLALVYRRKSMPHEALSAAREAVGVHQRLGRVVDAVPSYTLIGEILKDGRDRQGAAKAYARVLRLGNERRHAGHLVLAHIGIADILRVQGNLARACMHWQVAGRLARARGGMDKLVAALARSWRNADCAGQTGGPLDRPAPKAPPTPRVREVEA